MYPSAKFAKTVTKHDTVDNILDGAGIACKSRAIMVGVTGNVAFLDGNGDSAVITALVAGVIYPIETRRILSTSTTATGIIALW